MWFMASSYFSPIRAKFFVKILSLKPILVLHIIFTSISLKGYISPCSGSKNMTLSVCSLPLSAGVWTEANSSFEVRRPFLKKVLNFIDLGLLLTINPLITFFYPTNNFPKSKDRVWLPESLMIKRAKSTEVPYRSIWFFTKMEFDFSWIAPLNTPGSIDLYLTNTFYYLFGFIFNYLG